MAEIASVLILGAAVIAFVAGRRWQHFVRTVDDHKRARAQVRRYRAARWPALRTAVILLACLGVYIVATRAITG
ncbi:hypothetical protein SAMN05421678_104319 [Actinopolymorpha cephalotaxi]|uniref:Membrane protein n=1 Tax=Actinopolymorpha cephalotaxi TaxID=504797 RepID=A0A1I2Q0E2_9ACTN|nr:hypothetical protein [Actinopolymorpha cephalotaxi]NYH83433.1 putative membrane protein [Actinopolymorpha cephalotaxi]SFG20829.1 hypothetical protein SAMN05421678_104319 [Actinopolymorpha cephalotaxi]